MEENGDKNVHCLTFNRFKSSDSKIIFYSVLSVFAFGYHLNSMDYYSGTNYNVAMSIFIILVLILISKIESIVSRVDFWIYNLLLSILIGMLFFVFHSTVQDFNIIILVLSTAIFSMISLIKLTKEEIIYEKKDNINVKQLIRYCLQSEGLGLVIISSFWFIFFTMLQSCFWATESSVSTAALAVPDGAIASSFFSLFVILIAIILSTRKVEERLQKIFSLFLISVVFIWSWIIISTLIFAVELRLV